MQRQQRISADFRGSLPNEAAVAASNFLPLRRSPAHESRETIDWRRRHNQTAISSTPPTTSHVPTAVASAVGF
jgi:hypothetical protein